MVDGGFPVRSAHGPDNGRHRRARRGPGLDTALHAKCDSFGPPPAGAITGADVLETTLRVTPAQARGTSASSVAAQEASIRSPSALGVPAGAV